MELREVRFQINRFLEKKLTLIGLILVIAIIRMDIREGEVVDIIREFKQNEKRFTNSFFALTDNGTALNLPRDFITPEGREFEIADALSKLFVDRYTISKEFTISVFQKPTSIIDNADSLKDFFLEYVTIHKNKTPELKKFEAQGINATRAYTSHINNMFVSNTLPHFFKVIEIVDIPKDKFLIEDNAFKIEVHYKTLSNVYVGKDSNGKMIFEPTEGISKINATGFFDIKTTTKKDTKLGTKGLNKSGLHFIHWDVEYSIGK